MKKTPAPRTTEQVDEPAVRDAAEIAARIEADEAAAARARDEYRIQGLPELETDVAADLRPDEQIHATRSTAVVERSSISGETNGPSVGGLWVTSLRLICASAEAVSIALEDVDEMTISMGRLLLVRLADGSSLTIETDRPRLLRVQLAAAIEARRRG